ncbi:hypothetical protein DQ237_15630 [Blastococcus sp. TF02-8]|uniref:SurA N-terminal domain-containing protein n=1 Tax=Blastococcus sp. TF02-8 TaxID=2250574 RepID=UPI000DE90A4F|nr:SurA N-terminal domain-containing protein [Blastococcus sp. TF02-8]RBY95127.1 hypothetical protein DQ237_15630 [Blastococcus sp. TF02-8]
MLTRRPPRARAAVLLVAAALPLLAGCRSAPDVAAYVGDERITVTELEDAVRARLADDDIAAFAEGRRDEYTRQVLDRLVQREVATEAARRAGLRIGNDQVADRIEVLIGDDDPDAVYRQLAQQGVSREDVRDTVRQQLVQRELAAREGQADALDEDALRARYDQARADLATYEFGYVTVPDQATAEALLGELTADPARYGELAARFPGQYTLPALESESLDRIPPLLADQLKATAPRSGFTLPVQEIGGVVVGYVAGTVVPSFEESRVRLEEQAAGPVDEAGAALVEQVRQDLDVTVNPRYQLTDEGGRLVPVEGGVVDLLDDPAADAPEGGAAD